MNPVRPQDHSPSLRQSDTQRDARKFRNLVEALNKARQEVRQLETREKSNLVDILTRVLPYVARALDAEDAFIAQEVPQAPGASQRAWLEVVWSLQHSDLNGHRLERTDLLDQLLHSDRPRVIDPPGDSPERLVPGLEIFQTTSAILARVHTSETTYIVAVCNKRDQQRSGPFLAADRNTMESLLELIGAGLRIGEKRSRETRRLLDVQKAAQRISEAAAGQPTEKLPRVITRILMKHTAVDYAAVTLLNSERTQLVSWGAWVRDKRLRQRGQWSAENKRSNLDGYVASTRRQRYVENVNDPALPFAVSGPAGAMLRSRFVLPLISQRTVIGTLHVGCAAVNGVSLQARDFLRRLAPHVAVALNNARQMQVIQEQKSIRERVIEVQQSIADILDWNEQASQVRTTLQKYYDIDGFFLAHYDDKTERITLTKVYDHGDRVVPSDGVRDTIYDPRRLDERPGLIDLVIHRRRSVVIDDFDASPDAALIHPVYRKDIKSCIATPMWLGDRIVGVIGLRNYARTYAYKEYDLYFLETLGRAVAIVMDNAARYSQRIRNLRAVSEFQRRISAMDVPARSSEDALHSTQSVVESEIKGIYRWAQEALKEIDLPIDDMCVAIFDAEEQSLRFPVVYQEGREIGEDEKEFDLVYRPRRMGERKDVYDWFCRTGSEEPLLLNNRADMAAWIEANNPDAEQPMRSSSWLGAPMIAHDQFIGVLALRHFSLENAFEESHTELLHMVAGQAAVAIDNARLYENLRSYSLKLTRTNAIAAMAAWGADIVHDINKVVGDIRRSAHIVRQTPGLPENAVRRLERIDQLAGELEQPEVSDGFLELGSGQVRNPPVIDNLVRAETREHQRRKPEIDFSFAPGCSGVRVAMPEKWLRSVVRHLIKNGIDHLLPSQEAPRIAVSTLLLGEVVQLVVQDNGVGVREEIRDLLFRQPIHHDRPPAHGGSGRGLLLVGYIVETFGGTYYLDNEWSKTNKGARFVVQLPTAMQPTQREDAVSHESF